MRGRKVRFDGRSMLVLFSFVEYWSSKIKGSSLLIGMIWWKIGWRIIYCFV